MRNYVLITGASSGIGRAAAVRLSKSYPLILCGRDDTRLRKTLSLCESAEKHLIWRYNLANINELEESAVSLIKENSISVEGFVHSAGISVLKPLRMATIEQMREIMDINFFSAVELLKILASKKYNGTALEKVVFISSISSQFGTKGMALYSASKGALDSFARSMAVELAPRVRINTVLPGGISTPGTREMMQGTGASQNDSRYLLGAGTVQDIADMIMFLLSDKARWITGQNFIVDGGKTSHC